MNIGVAWGGYTSEKIISKMSGELVYNVLKIKHKVLYSIEFTRFIKNCFITQLKPRREEFWSIIK